MMADKKRLTRRQESPPPVRGKRLNVIFAFTGL